MGQVLRISFVCRSTRRPMNGADSLEIAAHPLFGASSLVDGAKVFLPASGV